MRSTDVDAGVGGNDNADWGRTVEISACEQWGLEFVANGPEESGPWWFDARARNTVRAGRPDRYGVIGSGTPVEVKAAKYRIDNGSPRRGRWWLAERSHDRLVSEDGEYALAVYTPDEGVVAMVLRPAWWVEKLITSWANTGPSHYASRSAQITWSSVFEDADDGLCIVNNAIRNTRASG